MRLFATLMLLALFVSVDNAEAQFSAQRDAANMATLRAVVNFKIDDEEIARDIESLRNNVRFNQDLQRRLDRLTNSRTKDSRNRRVMEILLQAGRDLDRALN